jgi:hypothetical protein
MREQKLVAAVVRRLALAVRCVSRLLTAARRPAAMGTRPLACVLAFSRRGRRSYFASVLSFSWA